MSKTSWSGLAIVLVAVAVPLWAIGLGDSGTVEPAVEPAVMPAVVPVVNIDSGQAATSTGEPGPPAESHEPNPVVPPVVPPPIVPPGITIGPILVTPPPAYHPSTISPIVPPPVRPPIGLGGPSIGVGGRGALVIPR
jgi:hypothetical protein